MMRTVLQTLTLLLLPALAAAEPPKLNIPAEVRPSGQYVVLMPDTDALCVTYVGLDGVEPFPPQFLKDARSFLLDSYGKPAGRYRFVAVAPSKDGKEQARAYFVVVLGNAPVPPGPGPQPPAPTPEPTDPFWPALRDLWAADATPDKRNKLELLKGCYVDAIKLTTTSMQPTTDLLFVKELRPLFASKLGDGDLAGVRKAISKNLDDLLPPVVGTPLNDRRSELVKQFNRYLDLLSHLN